MLAQTSTPVCSGRSSATCRYCSGVKPALAHAPDHVRLIGKPRLRSKLGPVEFCLRSMRPGSESNRQNDRRIAGARRLRYPIHLLLSQPNEGVILEQVIDAEV